MCENNKTELSESENLNHINKKEKSPNKDNCDSEHHVSYSPISIKLFEEVVKATRKKKKKLNGIKAEEVRFLLKTDVISFCQQHGLIATSVLCHCGKQMVLLHQHKFTDNVLWTCTDGLNHTITVSYRNGTWFENSQVPLFDILWISYMWVHDYSEISMLHESDNPPETVTLWRNRCSDACRAILECKCDVVGGPDKLVEILECKYLPEKNPTQKKKQRKKDEPWIFCAIEEQSMKSVLTVIDDTNSDSIYEIFDKYILPGTTVYSNTLCSYRNLKKEHFIYLTNRRSVTFFDGVHQSIIDTFEKFHNISCSPNRWIKYEYNSQFWEFAYRKSLAFSEDAFIKFLEDISKIYTPYDKIDK